MSEAPSYLKMLNGIALAESRAYQYLSAWAAVTPDDDVRATLRTVAAREGEHGMSFAKRINELGYELVDTPDPEFERRMQIAQSDMSDLEKADALGLLRYAPTDEPDVFERLFRDKSIDIQTGALLGRYIAEERDSIRRLLSCHAQLCAKAQPAAAVS